jgi:hypothetical protein
LRVIAGSVGLGTRHCEERSDEAIHCHRCSGADGIARLEQDVFFFQLKGLRFGSPIS